MSIIKRKAGSEDIVKSVLEFDEVPTEGSPNLVESGAVAEAIGNLGNPLQWKGPATVAELNAGITGIQEGWTYTLTDSGTLTDGSIPVDIGDEVAWTGTAWFKVGGETSPVVIFQFSGSDYPAFSDVAAAIEKGKTVVLINDGIVYTLANYQISDSQVTNVVFYSESDSSKKQLYYSSNSWKSQTLYDVKSGSIANIYDETSTYPVIGTPVMYRGNLYISNISITTAEAWTSSHWTRIRVADNLGSVKNGGSVAQSDGYASVENNSLTTITGVNVAALQVSVSFGNGSTEVPNFALEIDPTVDCTLTLKRYIGSSPLTLTPSVAGGNVMTAGKHYQVTCVGSCWTLAEFAMPNP